MKELEEKQVRKQNYFIIAAGFVPSSWKQQNNQQNLPSKNKMELRHGTMEMWTLRVKWKHTAWQTRKVQLEFFFTAVVEDSGFCRNFWKEAEVEISWSGYEMNSDPHLELPLMDSLKHNWIFKSLLHSIKLLTGSSVRAFFGHFRSSLKL